jgi:hypothetical protein
MGCRDEYATAAPLTRGHRRDGGQGRGDLLSPKRKSAGLVPEKLAAQNVPSAARVAAGDFGFLIFNQDFDGPDR